MGQAQAAPLKLEARYFLQKVKLGQGAFGTVWRAVDLCNQGVVAVKQMDKAHMQRQGVQREAADREVAVMRACRHTNIINLLDTFEDEGSVYLALEYCDGGDFGDKLKERGSRLQEHEAAGWMKDICSAVAALHCKGVCHRDIKPDNFMVSGEMLKLADFGLAVFLRPGQVLKDKCGTPAFMAPELHLLPARSLGYSLPADVWAVGVILACMLRDGRHPFIGPDGRLDDRGLVQGRLDLPPAPTGIRRRPSASERARELCRMMTAPLAEARISIEAAVRSRWLVDVLGGTSVLSPEKQARPTSAGGWLAQAVFTAADENATPKKQAQDQWHKELKKPREPLAARPGALPGHRRVRRGAVGAQARCGLLPLLCGEGGAHKGSFEELPVAL